MTELFQTSLEMPMDPIQRPPIHANTVFHIGVSGGKDSTAVLLWMLHESGIPREKLDVTFCDTGNEHDWTYEHIAMLGREVFPIQTVNPERGFFDLAFWKHRFPGTKSRFCTEFLKIKPSRDHIERLNYEGKNVIAVSGVRADESEERRELLEWGFSGTIGCIQWRPIIRWTLSDVLAIHEKYGIPLNPLYALGAMRVGCWPCIMSRKSEIRIIALKFPERIAEIRMAEQKFEKEYGRYSSFFSRNTVPERFRSKPFIQNGVQVMEDIVDSRGSKIGEKPMMVCTIDDVVRWSLSGKGAKGSWEDDEAEPATCTSGFCE